METFPETRLRRRYLRGLVVDQLRAFESGALQMRHAGANASSDAIWSLKRRIADLDALIFAGDA